MSSEPSTDTGSLTPWMFALNPFERWPPLLDDTERVLDLWHAGGVRGLVVGRLFFAAADGSPVPTFAADPTAYDDFGVPAPAPRPRDEVKEKRFHALLDGAASRGWEVLVFEVRGDAGSLPFEQDPFGAKRTAASVQDILRAYPQVTGMILDGPGEHPYELMPHRNREFLALDGAWRPRLAHLGYDMDRLDRGVASLRDAFSNLSPDRVRTWAPGGAMGALNLFDLDEDTLYWLRARREGTRAWMAATRDQLARLDRPIRTGVIPRTPALSALTGQDYAALGEHFDIVFAKHYYWHRGFDGLYGSVNRWVRQLQAWNDGLTEADAFAVLRLWTGIELPEIERLDDMEGGFPDAFFEQLVASETRRALEAVGDPDRVVGWVGTGRLPHAGDSMPSRDLKRMLNAVDGAGLRRFVWHATHLLGASEWSCISAHCGTRWRDDGMEWPADMDHNVIHFSGRAGTVHVP